MTIAGSCGNGGATTKVEVENNKCRDVDEKKNHGKEPCPLFPCH
jgi:hypothetical protein